MNIDKITRWGTFASGALTALLTLERLLETTSPSPEETSILHSAIILTSAAVAALGSFISAIKAGAK